MQLGTSAGCHTWLEGSDVLGGHGAAHMLKAVSVNDAKDPGSAAECLQCASTLRLEQEARSCSACLVAQDMTLALFVSRKRPPRFTR